MNSVSKKFDSPLRRLETNAQAEFPVDNLHKEKRLIYMSRLHICNSGIVYYMDAGVYCSELDMRLRYTLEFDRTVFQAYIFAITRYCYPESFRTLKNKDIHICTYSESAIRIVSYGRI